MLPLPGRHLSSLLLRYSGRLLLCDCGEGTQVAMRRVGWGFKALDGLLLSHLHADHVGGVLGVLLMAMQSGRDEPMTVYGPPSTVQALQGLCCVMPTPPFEVRVQELQGGERFQIGDLHVSCAAGDHGVPVLGYRLDLARAPRFDATRAARLGLPRPLWNRIQHGETVEHDGRRYVPADLLGPPRPGLSIAYITDTRPLPAHVTLARDCDLLVCEGTYGDPADSERAAAHHHMTFGEAANLAAAARVRRLWLTHFGPALTDPHRWADTARDRFAATDIGFDGMTTSVRFRDEPRNAHGER